MRAIRSRSLKMVVLLSAGVLFSPIGRHACLAADGVNVGELMKNAMRAMQAKQYDVAIENLQMYLEAVREAYNPRTIIIAQDMRYQLASLLINENRDSEAIDPLETYLNYPYGNRRREVMKMLANAQFESKEYEDAINTITNAFFYNKNANQVIDALKERIVAETGREIDEEFIKLDKGEIEPDYTDDEITALTMTLAECYYNDKKWRECIEPYQYVSEKTDSQQRKGYAIMQIINALVELEDFGRILTLVPELYRTPARYDIRVNIALVNVAQKLYDREMYDAALPLYRMVMPRHELIAYHADHLKALRIADGFPPEKGMELTEDEKAILRALGEDPDAQQIVEDDSEKSKELLELERLMEALKELPPYEDNVNYLMAQLYKQVQRNWEAVTFFEMVYANAPDSDLGERSIYELIDTMMVDLREVEAAERRAHAYLDENREGLTPRQIAYILNTEYQEQRNMEKVKSLLPYIQNLVRTNDQVIVQYDVQLYFLQGVADLILLNYESAEAGFKYVMDEFPGSEQEANAFYWWGMAKLFQQKYAEAFEVFEAYNEKYPKNQWESEAYYQAAVCLFGLEQLEEAKERFSYVIANYPKSTIYPEANSMRGDIYGSEGLLDEALMDYTEAYNHAKRPNQATYAIFQMAEIYEAEDKYDDIERVVTAYLEFWKERADIAKSLLWIGKTQIKQGRIDEAVDSYVNAIVQYGTDVKQDGVDQMVDELVKIAQIWLTDDQREALLARLDEALAATEDLTLQLRLRVALAKMDRAEIELGKQLLVELDNLDAASPPVLAVICDASAEMKNYDMAEEILRLFVNKFDESDFMRAAFRLRAQGQQEAGDLEGALATVKDTQERYGTDPDVAWAQLMKAQLLLAKGDLQLAHEANKDVFNVPMWRGWPQAQAMYQLGQVEEAKGDPLQAHGYYQRTYFQFKGHAGGKWAAEAYLAAARCLRELGRENDRRNTLRAMLFDRYVNQLPQADVARMALGAAEVAEIEAFIAAGGTTNITVAVEPGEVE
jgi:TolA-binding protein